MEKMQSILYIDRIKYKICLSTFDSLHGHGPEYISEMLIPRIIHYGLRSQDDLTLVVPRTKRTTLGGRAFRRAFRAAAPTLWNSLHYYPKMSAAATTLAFLRVN